MNTMEVASKPLVILHGEIKSPPLSAAARVETGMNLRKLQRGMMLSMPISRPMPVIGVRCAELRIVDMNTTWRIIYRVDADAVLIVEVFAKKTQATPKSVIAACKRRLRDYDALTKEFEMTEAKKKMLEAKGYKVTDSADWLGLSKEEAQLVDMRVALAQELERVRKAKGITQTELARRVGTKQSGVARMLNNPDTTTMDNLIKSLIALGEPISKIAACLLLCTNAN